MQRHRPIRHAGHEVVAVARASTRTHYHLRNRILIIFGSTAAFAVLCTFLVYLTERHAKGTEISTLFDSFLFTTSQLLTGSSERTGCPPVAGKHVPRRIRHRREPQTAARGSRRAGRRRL